jgi:hypothetical protein
MKRTILGTAGLALALFGFADDAAAQRPFRVGVIGGYNMASWAGDDADDADSRSGFDIGGLIQMPMGDMITIQPEVHFSQRGASFEEDDAGFEVALDYIHVPILFKAGLPLAEGFDFDFLVGPSLAFKLGCKVEPEDGDNVECEDSDFGEVKSFDFGIIGGGSFAWAAGPGDVLVDVRYDWGMTSIVEEAEDVDEIDIKNTALQFLIGYAFPL